MPTEYSVHWTDRADSEVDQTKEYLEFYYSPSVATQFLVDLRERVTMILAHPKSAPLTGEKPGVRGAVLTKQITIFYRVDSSQKQVHILSLFDTRQDPAKKNL